MELRDIYNSERVYTGKIIPRGGDLNENEYYVVVSVWIMDSEGKILLTKRHPLKKAYPSLWENTGGSALQGETSSEAALREVVEEIGVKVQESELLFLECVVEPNRFVDVYLVNKDIHLSNLTLQENEVVDAKWVTYEELLWMMKERLMTEPVYDRFKPLESLLRPKLNRF